MNSRITPETALLNDPNTPLAEKILAAATLWQIAEDCQAAIETFKTTARSVARTVGTPTVTLDGGGLSQCKVIFPPAQLKLIDGLTVEGERASVGPLFHDLYDVKLVLRKTDPAALEFLPPTVRAHMACVTTLIPSTPRVSLRVLTNVEEMK